MSGFKKNLESACSLGEPLWMCPCCTGWGRGDDVAMPTVHLAYSSLWCCWCWSRYHCHGNHGHLWGSEPRQQNQPANDKARIAIVNPPPLLDSYRIIAALSTCRKSTPLKQTESKYSRFTSWWILLKSPSAWLFSGLAVWSMNALYKTFLCLPDLI